MGRHISEREGMKREYIYCVKAEKEKKTYQSVWSPIYMKCCLFALISLVFLCVFNESRYFFLKNVDSGREFCKSHDLGDFYIPFIQTNSDSAFCLKYNTDILTSTKRTDIVWNVMEHDWQLSNG